ncbi:MAG: hypothetical protein AAGA61_04060, partial [Pseudomonadota bacterium]
MNTNLRAALVALATGAVSQAMSAPPTGGTTPTDRIVEIVLVEHLPDENRGWCIDAAGHQRNA